MKTILVPTDFSKNANHALRYAMELAKKENSKILLMHAYQNTYVAPDVPYQYASAIFGADIENTDKKLKGLQTKVLGNKVNCEIIKIEDSIVNAILAISEKKKPDIIVMGTKGANGLTEILIGSITAQVIEKAKFPVIAVPEKAKLSVHENICYATDYQNSDINALKKVVEIAQLFNATITIIHVAHESLAIENEQEYILKFKKKVAAKVKYPKIEYKLAHGKDVVKVLEDFMKKSKPDLFAMSTHHRNLYDKLFGTSITKKLAYHTKVPLLAFHHKNDSIFFI
jgi:nucleotide-binding universal stress UspA family protein